jgi:hypothetical protein
VFLFYFFYFLFFFRGMRSACSLYSSGVPLIFNLRVPAIQHDQLIKGIRRVPTGLNPMPKFSSFEKSWSNIQ